MIGDDGMSNEMGRVLTIANRVMAKMDCELISVGYDDYNYENIVIEFSHLGNFHSLIFPPLRLAVFSESRLESNVKRRLDPDLFWNEYRELTQQALRNDELKHSYRKLG